MTRIFDTFEILFVHIPQHPEVARYIRTARRAIYINLDADPNANVVQLIQ